MSGLSPSALRQLKRVVVEVFPDVCMGCEFDHGCSLHGCTVIKAAVEKLTPTIWTSVHGRPLYRACGVCGYRCRMKAIRGMHIAHCPGCGRPITLEPDHRPELCPYLPACPLSEYAQREIYHIANQSHLEYVFLLAVAVLDKTADVAALAAELAPMVERYGNSSMVLMAHEMGKAAAEELWASGCNDTAYSYRALSLMGQYNAALMEVRTDE